MNLNYPQSFIDNHAILLKDFVVDEKMGEDQVFSRKLNPDNLKHLAKSCEQDDVIVVSPATSRTLFGTVDQLREHWIKGKDETVGMILECVGDKGCAECAGQWELLVSRLAPADYHRFHAPISGKVVSVKTIQGDSFSVDPILVNSTKRVYSRNHRVILEIMPDSSLYEKAYIVIVGATCVDSIEISHGGVLGFKNSRGDWAARINKGQELGSFHYGGSTVLTLLCPSATSEKRVHLFADITSSVHARNGEECSQCKSNCAAVCNTELYTEVGVPIVCAGQRQSELKG
jgi:phosphatidylserine decarboxylase